MADTRGDAGDAVRTRRLAVSAALFSLATGISRILGLVRESIAAALLGTGPGGGAYTVANNVPNTVRSLVADAALGASLVPVFNELLERGESRRAWRIASTVLTVATVALTGLTIAGIFLARSILELTSDLSGAELDLAVRLAQILFPTLLMLGLSGIVNAVLNSFDEFFVPAIAPVFWNITIVAFLLVGFTVDDDRQRAELYALGTLVGTAVQLVLPMPWLRGRGGSLRLSLALHDPYVKRVFWLMLPVALGLGLINVNQFIATMIATYVDGSGRAARELEAAFRVYMLPQGMFSVAVAAVLFPTLSRLAAARDGRGFRRQVSSGLRQILFLLLPASVVAAVLAEPIVRFLYQRGVWTGSDTRATAGALAAFSLGLAANGVVLLLTRSFFSVQRVWLPTWVALGTLVANTGLNLALYRPLGAAGLALATSLVNLGSVVALWLLLERVIGYLDLWDVVDGLLRSLIAALLMGVVAFGAWWGIDHVLGRSLVAQLVALGVACTLAGATYLGLSRALQVPEAELVAGLVRRRLGRG